MARRRRPAPGGGGGPEGTVLRSALRALAERSRRLRAEARGFLDQARQTLGEPNYAAAWAKGQAMTLEQAIEEALGDEAPPAPAPRGAGAGGPLTRRELEVAALVALGLTNREIAARLVVTPRTVARHVEHILGKLGLTSRTQIGLWAAAHGLGPPPAAP